MAASALAAGQSVLVASKNHQALDAVEERLEGIATQTPFMVRTLNPAKDIDRDISSVLDELVGGANRHPGLPPDEAITYELHGLAAQRRDVLEMIETSRRLNCDLAEYLERRDAVVTARRNLGELVQERSAPPEPSRGGFLRRLLDWLLRRGRRAKGEKPESSRPIGMSLAEIDREIARLREGLSAQPKTRDPAKITDRIAELVPNWLARVLAHRCTVSAEVATDLDRAVADLALHGEGVLALTHNLVPEDEVLPAGKLYVSRTPARFHLLPGQDQISVYLRKETESAPRLARLEGIAKPDKATEVQLTLQQQPVAGRARLTLTSAALPTPHVIDFEAAETQGETWEEIIARHERSRPTIPDRLVLQCGMQVWDGFANRNGLSELLKREAARASPDWGALATQLSARPEQRFAINSDGSLLQALPLDDEATLDQMIDRAKREVLSRLTTRRYRDNDALKFLTWTFRRCPQEVIPHILVALDYPDHPFRRRGRLTLLLQGLGRTLRQPNDMRRAMDYLLALPSAAWKKDQTACMAFLISRTDDALSLLERPDVEYLAEIVRTGLERECGGHYTSTFIYLPILLVGLLRWRMVEPWALVAGQDPAADRMAEPLDAIIRDVTGRTGRDPRLVRYVELLKASREALSGGGGHSHLLADLFGLTTGASS